MLNLDELKYFIWKLDYLSKIKNFRRIQDGCQLVGVKGCSREAPLGGGGGGVWVSGIPLIFGQNIPYLVNFCGLYLYNASYSWWRHCT